jgi:glycosyltransferase involved in cell wall biosynthesis
LKILNLHIQGAGGGAEKVTTLLKPHFERKGITYIRVSCRATGADDSSDVTLSENNSLISTLFVAPWNLAKIIREESPDVIHIHCERPEFIFAVTSFFSRRWRKSVIVATEHNSKPWVNKTLLGGLVRRRLAAINVRWFTCMKNGSGLKFIPNPVQVAGELIKDGDQRLVSISRLVKQKGVERLIEAHIAADSDMKLVVIGEGDLSESLRNQAAGSPKVMFLGHQEFPWSMVRANDIFLTGSLHEGAPLALLEAISLNMRILASDIPEHRSMLAEDQIFSSVQELKQIIEEISRGNSSRILRSNSGETFQQEVLPENISEQWILEYQKLVSEAPA